VPNPDIKKAAAPGADDKTVKTGVEATPGATEKTPSPEAKAQAEQEKTRSALEAMGLEQDDLPLIQRYRQDKERVTRDWSRQHNKHNQDLTTEKKRLQDLRRQLEEALGDKDRDEDDRDDRRLERGDFRRERDRYRDDRDYRRREERRGSRDTDEGSFDEQWDEIQEKYQREYDKGRMTEAQALAAIERDRKALVRDFSRGRDAEPPDIEELVKRIVEKQYSDKERERDRQELDRSYDAELTAMAKKMGAKLGVDPKRLKVLLASELESADMENSEDVLKAVTSVAGFLTGLKGKETKDKKDQEEKKPPSPLVRKETKAGPEQSQPGVKSTLELATEAVLKDRGAA